MTLFNIYFHFYGIKAVAGEFVIEPLFHGVETRVTRGREGFVRSVAEGKKFVFTNRL